ncbi:MAG: cation diffusion facilitator family transporter [Bacillota bacterium]|nr:cation diffusion facilitator family transporter [Bacillota bacterium]
MLSKLLVRTFVKNSEDTENAKVRTAYGLLAGIVGIIVNIVLFGVKLFIGLMTKSIAITADAFNNLNDSASSIITIIGFKLSNVPPDEEHPFGHGRIEYLSAFLVSLMVILVGYEFTKSSIERIIHPEPLSFQIVPFILLLLSVLVKVWIAGFNRYIGNAIASGALKASSFDAFGDVIISGVAAITLLISLWISLPIDGYIGTLVSLFILYSGIKLVKETLNPILGEAPDAELVKAIKDGVQSYEHISGTHDLIIHNYGPGKFMATIHAEVPVNIDIVKIHDIIDDAERELSEKLGIILVIHMDPINIDDHEINETRREIEETLVSFPLIKSMHDFRIVGEGVHKSAIFDVVVNSSKKMSEKDEETLKEDINKKVKELHPKYDCVIKVDKDFTDL